MESLIALEAMERHVVRLARFRQVGPLLGGGGGAELAPGAVAQVENAVGVDHPIFERVGPFEGVIVVLEDQVDVVAFEQGNPLGSVQLAGPRLAPSASNFRNEG